MKGVAFRFCGALFALPLAAWLLPGVYAENGQIVWIAGALLGLIYLILRPLAKLILSPFNCLTFGIVGFLVDVGLVSLAAAWMPGFSIDGFWWTVAVALIVMVLRELLGSLAKDRA